ncbi:glutathione-disulfide reductase [Myxacorys almedinensis]|uniref:Glutathione-disulfide reductase n=1 Tax=Myxacorys almedinensis A TaxID=2690445 RepID=A0A8J7Z1A8_9CYAN|nr:glutathione-disulfide reductase [Myxacorys almedinensis]NDJ17844.1 glutathione-disulfide reductase [Myxacorys almedinensis A]
MTYDYDLFVIGAGPGGLAAAKRAANYGANVAIAEANHLGGTCVNLGCVPKKLMVYAADFPRLAAAYRGYGWTQSAPQLDWATLVSAQKQHIEHIRQSYVRSLEKSGIEIMRGRARFTDSHTLEINDRPITADKILIAVGGKAVKPGNISGIEHAVTSDSMFSLAQLPKSLVVIGGGYIGVEFSSMMHGFGVEVFLVEREPQILTGFDELICTTVRDRLQERGIHTFCNTSVKAIEKTENGISVDLEGEHTKTVTADLVLCAIGRAPNLEGLGLEQIGVELDGSAIVVNHSSRTSVSNIYAVGDCTNRMQLTPVAKTEGKAFAELVFGNYPCEVDYDSVPSAVCSRPEVASVGLSEAQAKEKFGTCADQSGSDRITSYQSEFQPLFHTLSKHKSETVIKLVVNHKDDRVLGIHIIGDNAAEVLQGFVLAFRKGVTKKEFDDTIGIHPSSAEEFFVID